MKQASSEIPALHEMFREAFKIGAAVSTGIIAAQGPFIAKHYNSITAENEMKPALVQPQEGSSPSRLRTVSSNSQRHTGSVSGAYASVA